ncbi:CPBP family intramembrane glutamic endopeptidase [Dongia sp.]|uniref:CPBP family intramembrane glutamic endopeptidase n=1 Tax=Dongia sp. TaxID=1977262 RepID=UPI0035B3021E
MTDIEAALAGRKNPAAAMPRQALLSCFILAALAMLPTQVYRLGADQALPWLLADYAGRLMAIGVLLALPAGRWCLRRKDDLKVGTLEAGAWVLGIVLLFHATPLDAMLASYFPQSPLGSYPSPKGLLYAFDITLGLALVALHEELVFRKLADHVMRAFGWGFWRIIIVSAILFGLYHWWRAPAGMLAAAIYGVLAMICYRRTGSLWPIGFAHYVIDYFYFA